MKINCAINNQTEGYLIDDSIFLFTKKTVNLRLYFHILVKLNHDTTIPSDFWVWLKIWLNEFIISTSIWSWLIVPLRWFTSCKIFVKSDLKWHLKNCFMSPYLSKYYMIFFHLLRRRWFQLMIYAWYHSEVKCQIIIFKCFNFHCC